MQATERDVAALQWAGEMFGVRLDLLAVLLGRLAEEPSLPLGREGTRRVVKRWERAGWVRCRQVERGGLSWVWPLPAAGLGWPAWRPRLGEIAHVHAVGCVRLLVEGRHPDSVWVSERMLRREVRSGYVPDGVVEFAQGRAAVEVELSVKARERLQGLMSRLASEYDRVFYFGGPRVLGRLERRLAELEVGNVQALPLPSVADVVAEDRDRGLQLPSGPAGSRVVV